jgi:hypothetical protein
MSKTTETFETYTCNMHMKKVETFGTYTYNIPV